MVEQVALVVNVECRRSVRTPFAVTLFPAVFGDLSNGKRIGPVVIIADSHIATNQRY